MQAILDFIRTIFDQLLYSLSTFDIADLLDIAIVAFLIYKSLEFFRETRAGTLIKGIIIVLVIYALSVWFDLIVLKWLLVKLASVAIIAVVIVFQPELRRALERVGRSNIGKIAKSQYFSAWNDAVSNAVNCISKAVGEMQETKTGALIVIERSTPLGDVIDTGTLINAETSSSLIMNIFFPKSPLHDGALIIRDGRTYAAGCILPLTANQDINSQLGTRHRAAIGISEVSDALVVVVSEETGTISIAFDGKIERGFNSASLRERLMILLDSESYINGERSWLRSKLGGLFKKKEGKSELEEE